MGYGSVAMFAQKQEADLSEVDVIFSLSDGISQGDIEGGDANPATPAALAKATNFLMGLLTKIPVESRRDTVQNLVQDLVDGTRSAEQFASELLRNSPQAEPQLAPFLVRVLPTLRQSLRAGKVKLPGIRPPPPPPVVHPQELGQPSNERLQPLALPSTSRCGSKDAQNRSSATTSSGATTLSCDKESSVSTKSDGQSVIRARSASCDSVMGDARTSQIDSISGTSGRHLWGSSKDVADYDPSGSSIKGDSISATIADYHRKHSGVKHRAVSSDNQSRVSSRQDSQLSAKNEDSSVNINYYAAAASSSSTVGTSQRDAQHERSRNQGHSREHRSKKHSRQRRINQIHQQPEREHSRNNSATSRRSSLLEQALNFYDLPQGIVYQMEPIIIRGNGNMTLFGLSNSFSSEFPAALLGRVSREEFDRTMSHINSVLMSQLSLSAKLLLVGGLFCCCSMGLSLVWPSIVLKRRSKANLEKFLANENQRLYSKLGLTWKLGQRSTNRFVEHVIIIEFNPKIDPYVPD